MSGAVLLAMPPARARDAVRSLLGSGRGLRHAVLLARDPGKLVRDYHDLLGFTATASAKQTGGPPSYTLSFGDGSSLVVLASRDTRRGSGWSRFLAGPEGAMSAALDVSPLDRTAAFLQSCGLSVRTLDLGEALPAELEFLKRAAGALSVSGEGVLASVLFFIESNRRVPQDSVRISPRHANTARKLAAVWIAVRDASAAAKAAAAMGLPPGREVRLPQVGARGHEVKTAGGTILLLQPEDPQGGVASYLNAHGEGIMGISLEVARITTAHRLVIATTRQELPTFRGLYGRSLLIPPDLAHGVWIELFQ